MLEQYWNVPSWLSAVHYQNPLIDYFGWLAIALFSYAVVYCLLNVVGGYLEKFAASTRTHLDDIIVHTLKGPWLLIAALLGGRFGLNYLNMQGPFVAGYMKFFSIGVGIWMGWIVVRLVDCAIDDYLVPSMKRAKNKMAEQSMPVMKRSSKIIIWVIVIVLILDVMGVDVGALVAGLGIGGLAVAFAAKDTLENFISGIMIFIDRPFTVKDMVHLGNYDGTIEEVGLRSTRLRTWDNTLVTVPNTAIVQNPLENYSQRRKRKVKIGIGLVYGTTAAKMDKAQKIIHKILDEQKKKVGKTDRMIHFDSFGDYSLNITGWYWIYDVENYWSIKSKINMEILKRFEKAKLEMAFPTQTIEYKKVR